MAKKTANKRTVEEMNDILYRHDHFVVVDIETTSLSPLKGGKIIEIGAVRIKDGAITETFHSFIYPEIKLSKKTKELTGITDEMLEGQPTYDQVLVDFYRFLDNAVVVAHNASFDWDTYLLYYFQRVGLFPNNEVVDTLPLARLYLKGLENHKLNTLCDLFSIDLTHHRADSDALATAKLLLVFKKDYCLMMYNDYELEPLQMDLMGNSLLEEPVAPPLVIERVAYWEKEIKKNTWLHRIYVQVNGGRMYYDLDYNRWINDSVQDVFSFQEIEKRVLKFLSLSSKEALMNYKGQKRLQ